jgi:acyl-CoA thioesterase-1
MTQLRISFIGDSLVAGTGDPDCLGWPGRISRNAVQRGHDITCYNLGIRGNTSDDILARWRREAEVRWVSGQDNRLVFQFGVNDTKDVDGKRILSPEQAIAQAREILSAAAAWLPVLMVGPPPIEDAARNARIGDMSARLAALAGETGIPYLDSFGELQKRPHWAAAVREGDGVHPTARGYEVWAGLIEDWPAWRTWVP